MITAFNFKDNKYKNPIFITLAFTIVGLLSITGLAGYRWYKSYQEAFAHKAFAEAFDEFNKEQNSQEAYYAFTEGAKRHEGSVLYPFFLFYESQVLNKQGKHLEALTTLKSGLDALSKNSPFYDLYNLKYALMQIDSQDKTVQQQGKDLLQLLSNNNKSEVQPLALYYLGYFSYAQDNIVQAQEYWSKMISLPDVPASLVNMVQQYISNIQ